MIKRLLALDQSTRVTGWSIFEEGKPIKYGKIDLKEDDLGKRLVELRKQVIELIKEENIDEVAFEDIQLQKTVDGRESVNNVQTFKALSEVYGVVLELVVEMDIKYHIVSSSSWKSTCNIKGKQRTEQKKNAQLYIQEKYGINVIQDICDSICIGEHVLFAKPTIIEWD